MLSRLHLVELLNVGRRAAAVLIFPVAAAVIWAPRTAGRRRLLPRQRSRRRALYVVMGALVFLALLPTVLPFDHLFVHAADASGASEAVHAQHCHVSPGTCSDAPVPSGPGQMLLAEPLVIVPVMLFVCVAATAPVLLGISFPPRTRPPAAA